MLARLLALLVVASITAATQAAAAGGPFRNGPVAFVRCCGTPETGIYVVAPTGGSGRRLVRARHDDAPLTPSWAPDGRRLAYAPGEPTGGIWTVRANGTEPRRVTRGLGGSLFPTWSTGGSLIAFADLQPGASGRHDLYRVRLDGTRLTRLTRSPADETRPAWAPNGGALLYDRGRDLWEMSADGSGQRLLVRNAGGASWSPGGAAFAFVRAGAPWTAKRDGSNQRRVQGAPFSVGAVAWSPDGRMLVVAPFDRGDLVMLPLDGSEPWPLTDEPELFHGAPSWRRLPAG